VVDAPTIPGDQDSGIVTSRLANQLGQSAITGRRVRVERFMPGAPSFVLVDGDAVEPAMESLADYQITVRDVRESERKIRAFTRGLTTSILPGGVMRPGVSGLALGTSIGNTLEFPLVARYHEGNYGLATRRLFQGFYRPGRSGHGVFSFEDYWNGTQDTVSEPRLIVNEDAEKAGIGVLDNSAVSGSDVTAEFTFPNVVLWWRPLAGGANDWVRIKPRLAIGTSTGRRAKPRNPTTPGTFIGNVIPNVMTVFSAEYVVFTTSPWAFFDKPIKLPTPLSDEPVRAAREIIAYPLGRGVPLPTDGELVEVVLQYVGPTTENFPYHWEGLAGVFFKNLCDGEFSPRYPTIFPPSPWEWDDGEALPTGIRYDQAALDRMTHTVTARIVEPWADVRSDIEKYFFAPQSFAPVLNREG
jgi:hypothetical protein